VGEHEDTRLERGTWGLYLESGGGDGSTVAVDNVLLTVPATDLDLDPPLTLDSWRSAQPAEIADELASNDLIPAGGRRTLLILETSYQIGSQEQRTYPQSEATLRPTDMVISIDAAIADGDNLACGIALRYVDDANQTIAYMDLDGGMGLLEVSDGMIRRHTYDFISENDAPLVNDMIRLLVIARQDRVLMYVNGEYFTAHHAPPRQGQIGVALINYSTLSSRCVYENLWVWQW
jgi:hypothetical protein